MNNGNEQTSIRTVIMRGGTSKALFIHENHLPQNQSERDSFILALYGSPDKRQIDGLGGADILTSKLAIIGFSSREDADINYTFGQVSIDQPYVSYDINCGNISSAVAMYAIEEGYVRPEEPITEVRIHNTNTNKILVAKVPVKNGYPLVEGNYQIDGVPGFGAEIKLDYSLTVGSSTSKLLPTDRVTDSLYIPSIDKSIEISFVDVANLCLFYRARDIGLTGTESPKDFTPEQIELIEEIRIEACKVLGLKENPLLPFQVAVSEPASYPRFGTGEMVEGEDIDVVVRLATKLGVHKAFPGTVGVCAAMAAMIPGTIIHQCTRHRDDFKQTVALGHPSGALPVHTEVKNEGGSIQPISLQYSRTARRLMEGYAFIPKSKIRNIQQ
jgi:2-methylaconitate cis-trans-isomerase PrpF